MSGSGKPTITFKYNDSGIRTQKIVDGVTTTYHLVGGKVTYEDNGTDRIYYSYDASEHLISMNLSKKNADGTWTIGEEYFYIRNAQGDIIGLYDKGGAEVVSYVYDSLGKLVSINGTLKDSVGVKNPYRYRGYRYDNETGLYYLQSRYYNPDWGRFINADAIIGSAGELLGHNVFAYCKNNVVNGKDPSGFISIYTEGEATEEMVEAGYKAMNTAAKNRSSSYQSKNFKDSNSINNIVGEVSNVTGSAGGAIILSAADCYSASKVAAAWNEWLFQPQSFSEAIESSLGGLYAASKITKAFGALAVAGLAIGVWDNFANYKHGFSRTIVDLSVFGGCALIGLGLATIGAPVVLGAALSIGGAAILTTVGNAIKNTWLKDTKG